VLLNVGARVNADTYDEHEGHRQPHVDIAVTHLRAGVHADSMERIARFCVTCVKHVQGAVVFFEPGRFIGGDEKCDDRHQSRRVSAWRFRP
jgi:hypothetical protein